MLLEFFAGACQGVAGNFITRFLECFLMTRADNGQCVSDDFEVNRDIESRVYGNFSIRFDMEDVLCATLEPVLHVVIEDVPTTHWHLPVLIVESRATGEWYVSKKGEMSLEGSGGGLAVAEKVLMICKEKNIPVAGWVCGRSLSDALAGGQALWPSVKNELVPLFSYAKSDCFSKYIMNRCRELGLA